jgi:hypothetical protein
MKDEREEFVSKMIWAFTILVLSFLLVGIINNAYFYYQKT